MTADEVRTRLNAIVDPCSAAAGAPAGLVEMGLVRRVDVTPAPEGCAIGVTIGLTEPGCMMGASFVAQARDLLGGLPGVAGVDVELEQDCDWSPRDLDPRYSARLEAVRAARREAAASGP
jgi:metal-sulfur cluster biosynthetic enzyme